MTRRGPPLPPDRLLEEPLIRVCRPDCRVHDDCSKPGKRPVVDAYEVEDLTEIVHWLKYGGNAGIALAETDIVVIDCDGDNPFNSTAASMFSPTFSVRTKNGVHQYVRCPDWSGNVQFTVDGVEWGSVRSDGWIAVVPPSRHPEGGFYSLMYDVEMREVEIEEIEEFVERVERELPGDQDDRDEDRRDRGAVAGDDLDELDELIDHDEYRAEVREALEDREAGHDRRVWIAGFLLDGVGLSVSETVRIIDKFNRWSNYDREITESQVESVDRSSGGRSR